MKPVYCISWFVQLIIVDNRSSLWMSWFSCSWFATYNALCHYITIRCISWHNNTRAYIWWGLAVNLKFISLMQLFLSIKLEIINSCPTWSPSRGGYSPHLREVLLQINHRLWNSAALLFIGWAWLCYFRDSNLRS